MEYKEMHGVFLEKNNISVFLRTLRGSVVTNINLSLSVPLSLSLSVPPWLRGYTKYRRCFKTLNTLPPININHDNSIIMKIMVQTTHYLISRISFSLHNGVLPLYSPPIPAWR
jgi:hypothetical protein